MDTSKDYYESVMRNFQTYGRGRSLEQFCRDEGADYKWIEKSKDQYGTPSKTRTTKVVRKTPQKSPDMIQLHFEPDQTEPPAEHQSIPLTDADAPRDTETAPKPQWKVASLRMTTPEGHEIEIKTSDPSAVSELLAKLTA